MSGLLVQLQKFLIILISESLLMTAAQKGTAPAVQQARFINHTCLPPELSGGGKAERRFLLSLKEAPLILTPGLLPGGISFCIPGDSNGWRAVSLVKRRPILNAQTAPILTGYMNRNSVDAS